MTSRTAALAQLLCCALLCCLPQAGAADEEAGVAGPASSASARAASTSLAPAPLIPELRPWVSALDETGQQVAYYYFNRSAAARLHGPGIIPFTHPERPTIQVRVGDELYPLLFDTGTYCCILLADQQSGLPAALRLAAGAEALATLEAKRRFSETGSQLDYAIAPALALSELRLRDVPLRIYRDGEGTQRDYAGAFAPILLRDYVIEVSNTHQQLRLHARARYLPPERCVVLPLLMLPRGLFVPLFVGGQPYWFHLDTGFSRELGLSPALVERHRELIQPSGSTADYQGWRDGYSLADLVLQELELRPYPALTWSVTAPLRFNDVPAVAYPDRYRELSDYGVGGVVGSPFLSRFDYQLDLELGRLYLVPREQP